VDIQPAYDGQARDIASDATLGMLCISRRAARSWVI
jgi:hypothetical protein